LDDEEIAYHPSNHPSKPISSTHNPFFFQFSRVKEQNAAILPSKERLGQGTVYGGISLEKGQGSEQMQTL